MNENDWILDVIVDLRAAAAANGLGALADHLSNALVIAKAEMTFPDHKAGARPNGEQNKAGPNFRIVGGYQHS